MAARPDSKPYCRHHAGKRFFGWLIPGVFSSTLSSQIGPFPCCYRSAGMARAGSGRARPSRAARGQGPSVGDGHLERPGCAGSSVRPPRPSPPRTPGAEERPYLAACKDDGRAGWLGSVRDGDTLRGRLGDRQRGQVRHQALLAPSPLPAPHTPRALLCMSSWPFGGPRAVLFLPHLRHRAEGRHPGARQGHG